MDEYQRFKVIELLELQNDKFFKFSDDAHIILNRGSHHDATHVGNTKWNQSFYVTLDNRDFCYDTKDHRWILCEWDTTCLADTDSFTKISFSIV